MTLLLSDVLLPALHAVAYIALAAFVRLHAAWRASTALLTQVAAYLAAAVPALRPVLAALCALPPNEHIGSRPQPPTVLGVVVADKDASLTDWPAAVEALGRLLSWAHQAGFQLLLLYHPSGSLQQQQHVRQLQLQLLQHRLQEVVRLQVGWQQQHAGGGTSSAAAGQRRDSLTAVLLSAADGQWPLLKAAASASAAGAQPEAWAGAAGCNGSVGCMEVATSRADADADVDGAAAIDAAIAAPAHVRRRIQAAAGALAGVEPDFVVVTGPALTLAGFPAWAVRGSELYHVGPLAQLSSSKLEEAMQRFCATKQRFGK